MKKCAKCQQDHEEGAACPAPAISSSSLTCPCCKSVVALADGALVGGEPSPDLEALRTKADTAAVLEDDLATAKQKLSELEASAAGEDDPDPPPATGRNYFL